MSQLQYWGGYLNIRHDYVKTHLSASYSESAVIYEHDFVITHVWGIILRISPFVIDIFFLVRDLWLWYWVFILVSIWSLHLVCFMFDVICNNLFIMCTLLQGHSENPLGSVPFWQALTLYLPCIVARLQGLPSLKVYWTTRHRTSNST